MHEHEFVFFLFFFLGTELMTGQRVYTESVCDCEVYSAVSSKHISKTFPAFKECLVLWKSSNLVSVVYLHPVRR